MAIMGGRAAIAAILIAVGWVAGRAQPQQPGFELVVEAPTGETAMKDNQAQLGHTDLKMACRHYTGIRLSKMKRTSETFEGRLGWAETLPRTLPRTGGQKGPRLAKTGRNLPGRKTA